MSIVQRETEIEEELNQEATELSKLFQDMDMEDRDPTALHSFPSSHVLICGDSRDIPADPKVHLIITSPPYNANMDYGSNFNDKKPLDEYLNFLDSHFKKWDQKLHPGGRVAINIRDVKIATGSRYMMGAFLNDRFCHNMGYTYRGVHIIYKGREESSMAWGSWRSSANPSIIDLFEYVYIFQKPGARPEGPNTDDISKEEFIESVLGVWKIRPEKKIFGKYKKNVLKHVCPFNVEIPYRLCKLYTRVGDFVYDPFAGVATTSVAAALAGRNSISGEISREYAEFGFQRMKKIFNEEFSKIKISMETI